MPALHSLQDLLVHELQDLYSAETQLTKALPRFAKSAQTSELRTAIEEQARHTEEHSRRLEQIADRLDVKPRGKKCVAMEGLIEEGKEFMGNSGEPDVLDAGLIGAAQKVEHYEISAYGTARTHAEQLGFSDIVRTLQQSLDEAAATNEELTRIAERLVNPHAAAASGGTSQHR